MTINKDRDNKNYFSEVGFKPSVSVNFRQLVTIVFIFIIILSIPFIYQFITDSEIHSLNDLFAHTINSLKIDTTTETSQLIFNVPLLNVPIDLTVLRRNPQLLIYGGLMLIIFAILIGITLIRDLSK